MVKQSESPFNLPQDTCDKFGLPYYSPDQVDQFARSVDRHHPTYRNRSVDSVLNSWTRYPTKGENKLPPKVSSRANNAPLSASVEEKHGHALKESDSQLLSYLQSILEGNSTSESHGSVVPEKNETDPVYTQISVANNDQHQTSCFSSIPRTQMGYVPKSLSSVNIWGLDGAESEAKGKGRNTPLHIFDEDDRSVLSNSSYPWNTIGMLVSSRGVCTGTLVAENVVVTASHCIPFREDGSVGTIKFLPGFHGFSAPFGVIGVNEVFSFNQNGGKVNAKQAAFDIACLVLDKKIGKKLGYFGTGVFEEEWLGRGEWTNVGYPQPTRSLSEGVIPLVQTEGKLNDMREFELCSLTSHLYTTTLDLTQGHSGGPVFGWIDGEPKLVAIVSSEFPPTSKFPDGRNNLCGGPMLSFVVGYHVHIQNRTAALILDLHAFHRSSGSFPIPSLPKDLEVFSNKQKLRKFVKILPPAKAKNDPHNNSQPSSPTSQSNPNAIDLTSNSQETPPSTSPTQSHNSFGSLQPENLNTSNNQPHPIAPPGALEDFHHDGADSSDLRPDRENFWIQASFPDVLDTIQSDAPSFLSPSDWSKACSSLKEFPPPPTPAFLIETISFPYGPSYRQTDPTQPPPNLNEPDLTNKSLHVCANTSVGFFKSRVHTSFEEQICMAEDVLSEHDIRLNRINTILRLVEKWIKMAKTPAKQPPPQSTPRPSPSERKALQTPLLAIAGTAPVTIPPILKAEQEMITLEANQPLEPDVPSVLSSSPFPRAPVQNPLLHPKPYPLDGQIDRPLSLFSLENGISVDPTKRQEEVKVERVHNKKEEEKERKEREKMRNHLIQVQKAMETDFIGQSVGLTPHTMLTSLSHSEAKSEDGEASLSPIAARILSDLTSPTLLDLTGGVGMNHTQFLLMTTLYSLQSVLQAVRMQCVELKGSVAVRLHHSLRQRYDSVLTRTKGILREKTAAPATLTPLGKKTEKEMEEKKKGKEANEGNKEEKALAVLRRKRVPDWSDGQNPKNALEGWQKGLVVWDYPFEVNLEASAPQHPSTSKKNVGSINVGRRKKEWMETYVCELIRLENAHKSAILPKNKPAPHKSFNFLPTLPSARAGQTDELSTLPSRLHFISTHPQTTQPDRASFLLQPLTVTRLLPPLSLQPVLALTTSPISTSFRPPKPPTFTSAPLELPTLPLHSLAIHLIQTSLISSLINSIPLQLTSSPIPSPSPFTSSSGHLNLSPQLQHILPSLPSSFPTSSLPLYKFTFISSLLQFISSTFFGEPASSPASTISIPPTPIHTPFPTDPQLPSLRPSTQSFMFGSSSLHLVVAFFHRLASALSTLLLTITSPTFVGVESAADEDMRTKRLSAKECTHDANDMSLSEQENEKKGKESKKKKDTKKELEAKKLEAAKTLNKDKRVTRKDRSLGLSEIAEVPIPPKKTKLKLVSRSMVTPQPSATPTPVFSDSPLLLHPKSERARETSSPTQRSKGDGEDEDDDRYDFLEMSDTTSDCIALPTPSAQCEVATQEPEPYMTSLTPLVSLVPPLGTALSFALERAEMGKEARGQKIVDEVVEREKKRREVERIERERMAQLSRLNKSISPLPVAGADLDAAVLAEQPELRKSSRKRRASRKSSPHTLAQSQSPTPLLSSTQPSPQQATILPTSVGSPFTPSASSEDAPQNQPNTMFQSFYSSKLAFDESVLTARVLFVFAELDKSLSKGKEESGRDASIMRVCGGELKEIKLIRSICFKLSHLLSEITDSWLEGRSNEHSLFLPLLGIFQHFSKHKACFPSYVYHVTSLISTQPLFLLQYNRRSHTLKTTAVSPSFLRFLFLPLVSESNSRMKEEREFTKQVDFGDEEGETENNNQLTEHAKGLVSNPFVREKILSERRFRNRIRVRQILHLGNTVELSHSPSSFDSLVTFTIPVSLLRSSGRDLGHVELETREMVREETMQRLANHLPLDWTRLFKPVPAEQLLIAQQTHQPLQAFSENTVISKILLNKDKRGIVKIKRSDVKPKPKAKSKSRKERSAWMTDDEVDKKVRKRVHRSSPIGTLSHSASLPRHAHHTPYHPSLHSLNSTPLVQLSRAPPSQLIQPPSGASPMMIQTAGSQQAGVGVLGGMKVGGFGITGVFVPPRAGQTGTNPSPLSMSGNFNPSPLTIQSLSHNTTVSVASPQTQPQTGSGLGQSPTGQTGVFTPRTPPHPGLGSEHFGNEFSMSGKLITGPSVALSTQTNLATVRPADSDLPVHCIISHSSKQSSDSALHVATATPTPHHTQSLPEQPFACDAFRDLPTWRTDNPQSVEADQATERLIIEQFDSTLDSTTPDKCGDGTIAYFGISTLQSATYAITVLPNTCRQDPLNTVTETTNTFSEATSAQTCVASSRSSVHSLLPQTDQPAIVRLAPKVNFDEWAGRLVQSQSVAVAASLDVVHSQSEEEWEEGEKYVNSRMQQEPVAPIGLNTSTNDGIREDQLDGQVKKEDQIGLSFGGLEYVPEEKRVMLGGSDSKMSHLHTSPTKNQPQSVSTAQQDPQTDKKGQEDSNQASQMLKDEPEDIVAPPRLPLSKAGQIPTNTSHHTIKLEDNADQVLFEMLKCGYPDTIEKRRKMKIEVRNGYILRTMEKRTQNQEEGVMLRDDKQEEDEDLRLFSVIEEMNKQQARMFSLSTDTPTSLPPFLAASLRRPPATQSHNNNGTAGIRLSSLFFSLNRASVSFKKGGRDYWYRVGGGRG
ncbi:putative trypsin-like peptidase domain-containing protein [Blattamonas nauphoetae]|uniref:Serine protease n=1 Tax=Blattamonas nauphoetae TaxID=2049346 RepID=A0ABQ9X2V6_9EUKA|nr:putative trypsin-like peptidase domain-containing protein [Blattamonas nauphoetae]